MAYRIAVCDDDPRDGGTVRLPIGDVQYAEAFSHSVAITAKGQTLRVKMSMFEVERLLGQGFVRCHRSYIAGLRHIARISRTEILLDSGKVLPISRSAAPTRLFPTIRGRRMKLFDFSSAAPLTGALPPIRMTSSPSIVTR